MNPFRHSPEGALMRTDRQDHAPTDPEPTNTEPTNTEPTDTEPTDTVGAEARYREHDDDPGHRPEGDRLADEPERDETWYDRAYGHERPDAMTTQLPGTGPAPTPDQEDTPDHTPDHGPDHEPAHEAGLAEDAPLGGQVDGGEPESAAPDSVVGLSATAVWGDERSAEFRNRWREAQLAFVDDPRAATTDAKELVSAAIEALTVALNEQRSTLDAWESGDGDTEQLRQAMRQYRVFFDHVLGL